MSDQENNLNPDSQMPGDEALDRLIYTYLEGTLSPQDTVILTRYLKDPRCVKYFVERCKQEQVLYDLITSSWQSQEDTCCSFELDVWQKLARYEDHAPAVPFEKIVEPTPAQDLLPAKVRRVNKTSLITAIVSIAALIFMIAYVNLFPPAPKEPVATLADAINVRWESSNDPRKGERLFAGDGLMCLQQGLIRIKFDNGASVIVEAPSMFELNAPDQLRLHSGRLYAAVPKEAIGFTVNVENTRIIDLGTEFGVQSDENKAMELHVLKGKTMLIAGAKSNKTSMEVGAGYAKKVFGAAQKISDIVCNDRLFVRKIDSDRGLIWRGQTEFNLADIVGGGNGFGTGQIGKGVNLSNGKCLSDFTGSGRRGTGRYIPVPELDFVDGVFVPNSKESSVQITSQGHVFKECPETSGEYFDEIRNGGIIKRYNKDTGPMELEGRRYGTLQNPVLYMHANAGITFDLDAIRNAMPGFDVEVFRSLCGISTNSETVQISKADIFVLVDGQLRKSASLTRDSMTAADIEIKLAKTDRFLTLVSTDGGNGIGSDWVMFTKPYLILKQAE